MCFENLKLKKIVCYFIKSDATSESAWPHCDSVMFLIYIFSTEYILNNETDYVYDLEKGNITKTVYFKCT